MSRGLDMRRYGVRKIRDPSVGSDVATRGYVDRSITSSTASFTEKVTGKVTEVSTRIDGLVKLDGSSVMTGTSDMGRNSIRNVGDPPTETEVATKGYADRTTTALVKCDGSSTVTGNSNMQNHKSFILLTKKYVDDNLFRDRLSGSYSYFGRVQEFQYARHSFSIPLTSKPTLKLIITITLQVPTHADNSHSGEQYSRNTATQLISATLEDPSRSARNNIILPIILMPNRPKTC